MKKLRVAILIDAWFPFYGGGQVHIRETTKILEKKYNCEIVIFHGFSPNLLPRIVWNFLVIFEVSLRHFRKPFDLIHAQAYSPGIPAKVLSFILKIPVVFSVHGSNSLDLKTKGLKNFLEKWILTGTRYDCQTSDTNSFLKYKNVNKNIRVIANGVDIKRFKVQGSRFKVQKGKTRLLFVGRLEEVKGVSVLLKALARVKNKLPDWQLRVVGEGSLRKGLEESMHRTDLCRQVEFLGRKVEKDLIKEYKKADIFVLPSLSEGHPLTLLEAWAAKLPVLVTGVGDNSKMVKEGKNGFLVKEGSIQRLAQGLEKAFEFQKQWRKMGRAGYNLVVKNYTWEKTAKKIYEVYKEMLK